MKSSQAWIRHSQRVIRMVSELHRMGFQRLRFMPYEYPLAYRVQIGPSSIFSVRNGAYVVGDNGQCLEYSSASGDSYFDWHGIAGHSARQLADEVVLKRGALVKQGQGRDWEYAGWLSELLGVMEANPSRLPIVQAEFFEPGPEELRAVPLRLYGAREGSDDDGGELTFPLPPPPLDAGR